MDRGVWQAPVQARKESDTAEWLSTAQRCHQVKKLDWEPRQEPGWALGGETGAAPRTRETYRLTRAPQCLGNSAEYNVTQRHPQAPDSQNLLSPPLTQQTLIIRLLCADTVPGPVALHWIKPTKPVSAWNISVHSRRIPHSTLSLIHQRRPRLVTWFVPWDWSCLRRAGKISVRKWAGGDGCLRATLSLCPALLGGEAFPRLGEALHFRNNPLRCFWLLKHVTMATDKLHYWASENHLLDFNLLFKDGEDYKSCNNTSSNILSSIFAA